MVPLVTAHQGLNGLIYLRIIMANELLREQLLNYLAYEYETKGPAMVSMLDFSEKVGVPFSQIVPIISMLHSQGLIETVVGEAHALIQPKGYELAKPSDISTPSTGNTNINFNAPVSGSAIAVGNSSAQVTNNYSDNNSAKLIEDLKQTIEQLSIPELQKVESRELVTAIENQFTSGKPSYPVVKSLLSALPDVASLASIGSFILACIR